MKVCRRSLPRLNRLEDHGSGLLDESQRFRKGYLVAGVKLDVIAARCIGIESDGGTDHESHGFGFGLTDGMGGFFAPVAAVEKFVRRFVSEYREGLRRWHIR